MYHFLLRPQYFLDSSVHVYVWKLILTKVQFTNLCNEGKPAQWASVDEY